MEKLRDLATFLGQYFDLSKGIVDLRKRHNFFGKLASCGLFDALLTLLSFPDEKVQLTTCVRLCSSLYASFATDLKQSWPPSHGGDGNSDHDEGVHHFGCSERE